MKDTRTEYEKFLQKLIVGIAAAAFPERMKLSPDQNGNGGKFSSNVIAYAVDIATEYYAQNASPK